MAESFKELGDNFHEFFSSLQILAGNPGETEMWKGFRAAKVRVSPTTVRNWVNGRTIPSPYYRPYIQEIFELSDDQFVFLERGSELYLGELALQEFEEFAYSTGITTGQATRLAKLIIETS